MIDLESERTISLQEAARRYPSGREGKPTHVATVLRHITMGVRGPNGEIVRLDGTRLGRRWITSIEAIQRFSERLTAATISNQAQAPGVATSASRKRELERIKRELDAAGI
jgi:hypothetical protein